MDAAKEVRTDLEGMRLSNASSEDIMLILCLFDAGYKKKVRRLVRRSAEESFD